MAVLPLKVLGEDSPVAHSALMRPQWIGWCTALRAGQGSARPLPPMPQVLSPVMGSKG